MLAKKFFFYYIFVFCILLPKFKFEIKNSNCRDFWEVLLKINLPFYVKDNCVIASISLP